MLDRNSFEDKDHMSISCVSSPVVPTISLLCLMIEGVATIHVDEYMSDGRLSLK